MSLLTRLAGTDDAQPAARVPEQPAGVAPSVHGSMMVRFGAPVLPASMVRSR